MPKVDNGFVLRLEGIHLVEIENDGDVEKVEEWEVITSYEQYRHLYDTAVWKSVDLYAVPQIVAKLEELAKLKKEAAPLLNRIKELENGIKSEVLETGEVIFHAGIDVSIRKGYERVSWNGKGLDGYAVSHPDVLEFRKESQVKASAVIKGPTL